MPFEILEDNDYVHNTKNPALPQAYLKGLLGIVSRANIPQSPNLNIIENVWRIVKQRVKAHWRYKTKEELKFVIEIEWNRLREDPTYINE